MDLPERLNGVTWGQRMANVEIVKSGGFNSLGSRKLVRLNDGQSKMEGIVFHGVKPLGVGVALRPGQGLPFPGSWGRMTRTGKEYPAKRHCRASQG